MKQIDYEIVDEVSPDDESWTEWKATVQAEGWVASGDDSTLSLTPQLSKAVIARSKSDGRYIGSVVWSENDGLAYIGFYILRPEFRGLGIGTAIWNRALARIAPGSVIGLTSIDYMVPRYKARDTPVEGQHVISQRIRADDLMEIAKSHILPHSAAKLVSELSQKEFDAMLSYANEVSGVILTDSVGQIRGFASVVTAGPREGHVYKVAPVYADGVDEALSAIYPLLDFVHKQDHDAIVILAKWSNSAGEKLHEFIKDKATVSKRTAYTLFSRPYASSMDFTRMFVAHSHSGHFDA